MTDILSGREQDCGLGKNNCWAILGLMETCKEYLSVNTGVKHVFGLIAVKSIELLK